MKHNDIFLDFTPLLDVTLILLFFFIMFSSMEVIETKSDLDAQSAQVADTQAQLDDKISEYDTLQQEVQLKLDRLDEDLEILANTDKQEAANAQALMEFNRSANLKLILSLDGTEPGLRVLCKNEYTATIQLTDSLSAHLSEILTKEGYHTTDTVFCELILDGSEPGSAHAYRTIQKQLINLRQNYPSFYISETDLSIGKDETP